MLEFVYLYLDNDILRIGFFATDKQ